MHDLQRVERHPRRQLDVAEARQVVDPGEVGQPGQPSAVEVALELVERLLLGPAPLVGGAQVVDGQLGQAEPQGRAIPGSDRLAYTRSELSAHGWRPRAVRYSPCGSMMQQPVAPVGPHDPARQDLHQVGLAHAGGGEDADVGGQARPRDADGEVDDGLPAAQLARRAGRPSARPGRRSPRPSGPPPPRTGWAGSWACGTPIRIPPDPTSGRGQVPEAATVGHPVGAPVLLVQGMRRRVSPRSSSASRVPATRSAQPGSRCSLP